MPIFVYSAAVANIEVEFIYALVQNANKSIEKGKRLCVDAAPAQKLCETRLADDPLPRLRVLREELLPPRTPGDETGDHLFGEVERLRCKTAYGRHVKMRKGLKSTLVRSLPIG